MRGPDDLFNRPVPSLGGGDRNTSSAPTSPEKRLEMAAALRQLRELYQAPVNASGEVVRIPFMYSRTIAMGGGGEIITPMIQDTRIYIVNLSIVISTVSGAGVTTANAAIGIGNKNVTPGGVFNFASDYFWLERFVVGSAPGDSVGFSRETNPYFLPPNIPYHLHWSSPGAVSVTFTINTDGYYMYTSAR